MKSAGSILHEARSGKRLTLEDVERATKIRKKFLEAIERDEYYKLPSLAYAKGFVKNYSEYLGLPSTKVLAFFRRQSQDITKNSLLPKGVAYPVNMSFFRLTPSRFLLMVTVTLVASFLLYLGLQYQKLRQQPILLIESPLDESTASGRLVEVFGKTDRDATVAINDMSVIVRSDGKFFEQVELIEGKNTITIIATSRYGKSTTVTRSITTNQP